MKMLHYLRMTFEGLTSDQQDDLLPPDGKLIFLGYRGSIVHGTYVPSDDPDAIDDRDVMGVWIGPAEHYLGYGRRDTHERFTGQWDAVHYELRKLFRLLLKSNPNVLSLLFLPREHWLFGTPTWEAVVAARKLFLSKEAFTAYAGYANGQLRRMERTEFEGYMGAKRKALVERHGYDTKNAAHLIRLLRECVEFMQTGEIRSPRPDAAELRAIKSGALTLEEVKVKAEVLFEDAHEAKEKSSLPDEIDRKGIEKLLTGLLGSEVRRDLEARYF